MANFLASRSPDSGKEIILADFSFSDIDGKSYHLIDFNNQKVIVHFWATWCPPCIVELPLLYDYMKKHPEVILLAFSADSSKEALTGFTAGLPASPNIIHIWDENGTIGRSRFSLEGYPETFLLDKNRVRRAHIQGTIDWRNPPDF